MFRFQGMVLVSMDIPRGIPIVEEARILILGVAMTLAVKGHFVVH